LLRLANNLLLAGTRIKGSLLTMTKLGKQQLKDVTVNQLRIPPVAVATSPEWVIEILYCLAVSHLQPLEAEAIHRGP
jgi:hypothetical protein